MFSVVSPFYNEEPILARSVQRMLVNLAKAGEALQEDWELIIVNDGSKDESLEIAHQLCQENPKLKLVSYSANKGRGYAIRKGVAAATGSVVVTTEVDSSWGDDIVFRLVEHLRENPSVDIVIASPNLPKGGYRNVPFKRVVLSRLGNAIIRLGFTGKITMNTGMTRGYKREKFLDLPLEENEKEIHLEIVNKAMAFQYKITEIPAFIEWQKEFGVKRKSSAKVKKLIRTHLSFSFEVAPFRYLYTVAALCGIAAFGFSVFAVYRFLFHPPAIYSILTSLLLYVLGLLFFGIGVLTKQNWILLKNSWKIQSLLLKDGMTGREKVEPLMPSQSQDAPSLLKYHPTKDLPPKPLL